MSVESHLLASFPPYPIELDRAEGCELIARDGRRYIDLYGGHCVAILGHNPPALIRALEKQMRRITFYSAALALPERDAAAKALTDFAPEGFDGVFFVNSGAEANENAIKCACALTGRKRIVSIEGGFHGRTAGTDPLGGALDRKPHYPDIPFNLTRVAFGDSDALVDALQAEDVAAVILEPVQSMAGCRVHPPEFIEKLNKAAKVTGTLIIADEVQGGFWRCLERWSHQTIGMHADFITCAKGLAGGFPAGAMIMRSSLGELPKALLGSTFGGGPLASAAINAVLAELSKPELSQNVAKVSAILDSATEVDGVSEVLGIGMLRGLRLEMPAAEAKSQLLEKGYIVGGSNDPEVIRLMPPLILREEQARDFLEALAEVLGE